MPMKAPAAVVQSLIGHITARKFINLTSPGKDARASAPARLPDLGRGTAGSRREGLIGYPLGYEQFN